MDFTEPNLSNLPGGKKDEDSLRVLFTILGFKVIVHQNLTGQEITSKVESYSRMEHTGVFFLAVLSHGCLVDNMPAVCGTDGVNIEVHSQLESLFFATVCPSLAHIPKIFLIDACRGSQRESSYSIHKHQTIPKLHKGGIDNEDSSAGHNDTYGDVTDSADFVLVFASTHGNVALMHRHDKGSYLTQAFANVITEATPDRSFLEITREVEARVQESGANQTVEVHHRLRRTYRIKRFVMRHHSLQN